jgi:hypothetical protein
VVDDLAHRHFGSDHRLGLIVGPGSGSEQQREVGDRLLDGIEQLGAVENMVGTGRGALGGDVRPAVARVDDPKPRKRKIAHRARGHADVFAELRLDQDNDRAFEIAACLGLVGARTGHLTSLSDSTSEEFESGPEQPDSTSHPWALAGAAAGKIPQGN